jgi:thiol-disulfide isomerase/thioredoxin
MDGPAGDGTTSTRRGWSRSRPAWAIAATALIGVGAVIVLNAAGQPAAPRPPLRAAMNFSLPELGHDGTTVSLTAYTGRPVIINFFASWCAPCQRETPLLASFYREHHGQVAIIGVDSNDEAGAAQRFLASDRVTYPVGVDAFPDPVAAAYNIGTLPQTFVLNSRHQIVRHISGDVTLAELTSWAASFASSAGPG